MAKTTKKAVKNESQRKVPRYESNDVQYEEPCWLYPDQTLEEMHKDEEKVPQLLNRLRELGVVQVVKSIGRVYFYPIHDTRPLVLYDKNPERNTKWEWLRPHHVYETVNYLMWKRYMKPELALAFMGIFDYIFTPESDWGYYISVGDLAFNHVNDWLSE
jgi:hypothetical protein